MTIEQWQALMVRAVSRDPDVGSQAVKAVENHDYFRAEGLFAQLGLEARAEDLRLFVASQEGCETAP